MEMRARTVSWDSLVEMANTNNGDWNLNQGIIDYVVSNNSSFEYIEKRFRAEKINARILAVSSTADWMVTLDPLTNKYIPIDQSKWKCLDPITREPKKYRIWVLKGGHYIWQLEELQKLTEDLTFQENAKKLIDAGVLHSKFD